MEVSYTALQVVKYGKAHPPSGNRIPVKQGRIANIPSTEFAKNTGTHQPLWSHPEKEQTWQMAVNPQSVLPLQRATGVNDGISKDLCSLSYVQLMTQWQNGVSVSHFQSRPADTVVHWHAWSLCQKSQDPFAYMLTFND